jgi:hypothetical protein
MASVIRIKRSGSTGAPSGLASGELAYSALSGTQSNGGDRLYIGFGTPETSGIAPNMYVIGGKYFTDMLDHVTGTLTASSALIVDSNSKLDNLKVDNLDLNGNTISSTDTNGNITLTPNGTGKLVLNNPYIGGDSVTLAEFIYDTVGGAVTGGTGITVTNDDGANTSTIRITDTTVTGAGTPVGSSTAIPVITFNAQGQLTAVSTASITTTLGIAGDTGTDSISLATDTLTFTGGTGITSSVNGSANSVTFDIDNTVVTLDGTQTLTNKTLTNPVITGLTISGVVVSDSSIVFEGATADDFETTLTVTNPTEDRTVTIPDATGTVVLADLAQTLTNKSINLANNTLTATSAQLATALTDETGSGVVVFGTSPAFTTSVTTASTTFAVFNTGATTVNAFGAATALSLGAGTGTTTVNNDLSLATGKVFQINGTSVLSATALGSAVVSSSLTSVGTIATGVWEATDIGVAHGGTGTSTGSITGTGALTFTAGGTDTNVNLVPNGTGIVDVGGKRVGNAANPTQSSDLATKAYVDSLSNGLDVKASVRAATTANITLSNTQTIDGVALSVGDRVLVKNQSTGSQNGIYVVASGSWSRAADFDNSPDIEVSPGTFFFVEEGTTQADNGYVVSNDTAITIGTTEITFSQFSGAGQITAGAGLTKSGNTLDVVGTADRITVNTDSVDIASTYVGQTSITTLGTITTGTWQGTIVDPTYGGTGVNNGSKTITLGGSFTHSGAHTLGVTTTANTSVTLPTTGTLATLAGTESLSNKTITSSSFSGTTIAGSGLITFTNSTDASNLTTAAVILSGGLAVTKAMYVGTNITGAGAGTSTLDGFNIDGGTY